VNEKLDRALSDFIAGTSAGVKEANERWLEFLKKERADASEALADADPFSEELTETPTYLCGWFDALDYLIHREARYEPKP
jgi:hypothetical protein